MFSRLSLNIHNPISDPLIDPSTSYRNLGTSEVIIGQVLVIGWTSPGHGGHVTAGSGGGWRTHGRRSPGHGRGPVTSPIVSGTARST